MATQGGCWGPTLCQGLQCLKQIVTSPKSQLGCPNSLNMGSLPDVHRSQYLRQEFLRREIYCKADQCRRQGFKCLFNSAAWVKSNWSEVKVFQSCPTLWDPMDYTVHGILQARILEWVAFPFSRGSSKPRDRTRSPALQVDSLPAESQWKPLKSKGSGEFLTWKLIS